jgi:hypothetical protein
VRQLNSYTLYMCVKKPNQKKYLSQKNQIYCFFFEKFSFPANP